jgi:phage/plasmid-like protein (TIGR03299 family)
MGTNQYGQIGGVDSSVSARFTPWMGLTDTIVRTEDRLIDAFAAHKLAGIDWQVNEQLLSDIIPNDGADEHKIRLRADNGMVLGIGSPKYGLIQNDSVAHLAQEIINFRHDAHVESAGALHKGKVVWNLIALDESTRTLSGGEQMYRYLLVYTSHDGSKPFAVRFTNVRVQCMNTFSAAMGKANELVHTVRHTSNALAYVKEAEDSVKQAVATFDLMDLEIERLLSMPITKTEMYSQVKQVIGEPTNTKIGMTKWNNHLDDILREYDADFNSNIKNTQWGFVMAINGYELWHQAARKQTKSQKQMLHLLNGQYPLTQKALAVVGA